MSVPGLEPPASDDLKNVLKRFHSLRMRAHTLPLSRFFIIITTSKNVLKRFHSLRMRVVPFWL